MANGVTTQWHDIHVRLGNFEAGPKEKKQDEIQKEYLGKLEKVDPLEHKTAEELKEMEEDALDEEDEKMFREYLDKRKSEISSYKAKPKFGDIIEISRDEYVREVTNAPKGVFVVLHLYQDSIESCHLINRFFAEISKEHPHVKFLKIVSTKAIENYPERNVPTVLI
jgi:Phosducin